MKRFWTGLLAGLLLLSLAACGRSGEPAPQPEPSAAEALPTEAPVRITEPPAPQPSDLPEPRKIEPADSELVCVRDYIPELQVDLRYAGPDNFTGQTIYDFTDAWLRYGTVKKLRTAQDALKEAGYCLLIWDAYRPAASQFRLWAVVPDGNYVANPYAGHSTHSNGGTVDLTMLCLDGSSPEMPTGFDDFSLLADRDYWDVSEAAGQHARLLEQTMEQAGFRPYAGEWWHFSDTEPYPYEDLERLRFPLDRRTVFEPDCEGPVSLRAAPDRDAEVLAQIAPGTGFQVLGWAGDFARIELQGQQGYVAADDIRVKP